MSTVSASAKNEASLRMAKLPSFFQTGNTADTLVNAFFRQQLGGRAFGKLLRLHMTLVCRGIPGAEMTNRIAAVRLFDVDTDGHVRSVKRLCGPSV